MQLSPRYGGVPVISLDGVPSEIVGPTVRQRRRLADALASFGAEQWAHPSRCEGWSNRDVIVHLDSTNSFWAHSITSGLQGEPTQFLATFDPVESPAQLVAGSTDLSTTEVFDRFAASTDNLVRVLESIDGDGWSALAEAPPGHVGISAVAHHALWDSWVHERDIFVPLGRAPEEEADEVVACLRYVAALGPALAVNRRAGHSGTMTIVATAPDIAFFVEIADRVVVRAGTADADLRLTGDAVELVEAFSLRMPFSQQIAPESSWMLSGLTEQFDADERG